MDLRLKHRFEYRWFNFKTHERGKSVVELPSRMVFLDTLARWNQEGFGEWQYAE